MKPFSILAGVMAVLFLAAPNKVEAQKKATNKSMASAAATQVAKCAVAVRNDLIPKRGVVVVGCDSFGDTPFMALNNDGTERETTIPSNGGLIVFDAEMNVIFKWEACSACGGFFSHFAGTKKIRGHNALMVQLVNGPRMDAGGRLEPIVPLYFDGRKFTFADK